MKKTQKPTETMGAHWEQTLFSPLYRLSRRVETVARKLERRRKRGWVATKKYIAELYEISTKLKIIDSRSNRSAKTAQTKGSASRN
jgi:hypothetical protein